MAHKKQIIQTIIATLTTVTLFACGSGNSIPSVANTNPLNPSAQTGTGTIKTANGQAIDGLDYYNGMQTGITSDGGKFSYSPGEEVIFYLNISANVTIGNAFAKDNMVISDLTTDSNAAQNITTFLEAIDDDGNPNNGIMINQTVNGKALATIDWEGNEEQFARVYGSYAKYLAGFTTAATGDIGQTTATYNITLAPGVALYFPATPTDESDIYGSSFAGVVRTSSTDNNKAGLYLIGLSPGTATLDISNYLLKTKSTFNIIINAPQDPFL